MELKVVVQGVNKETGEVGRFAINLPTNPNDVMEQTGIDTELYEIEILEHDFGFEIGDRLWLRDLNKLANLMRDFENDPRFKLIKPIANEWYGGNSLVALQNLGEVRYLKGVDDYSALANKFISRSKTAGYIAPFMRQFFDISAYASYLRAQGGYLFSDGYVFYQNRKKSEIEG